MHKLWSWMLMTMIRCRCQILLGNWGIGWVSFTGEWVLSYRCHQCQSWLSANWEIGLTQFHTKNPELWLEGVPVRVAAMPMSAIDMVTRARCSVSGMLVRRVEGKSVFAGSLSWKINNVDAGTVWQQSSHDAAVRRKKFMVRLWQQRVHTTALW